MDQMTTKTKSDNQASGHAEKATKKSGQWKKPVLEDVSEKVMAQPYIRFT